jgi:hypothetical protein
MNELQQRIKIAEACGWTDIRSTNPPCGYTTRYKGTPSETCIELPIPDFLNDLNAMHEAELLLFAKGWEWQVRYYDHLLGLSGCMNSGIHTLTLTAAQRAEAFLKILQTEEDGE